MLNKGLFTKIKIHSKQYRTSTKIWSSLCILLALIGLPVFAGWNESSAIFKNIFSLWAQMKFNTALCFFLIGVGLLTTSFEKKYLSRALGIIVVMLGVLTLIQYFYGINLGIDELFKKVTHDPETSNYGRMSPNSSLNFVFIGLALLAFSWRKLGRRSAYISGMISCLPVAFGTITLIGHLVNFHISFGWGSYSLMTVPTSIGFILSGLLILSGVINFYNKNKDKTYHITSIFVTLVLFLFSGILWQFLAIRNAQGVNRTTQINIENFKSAIIQNIEQYALALKRFANRVEHLGVNNNSYLNLDGDSYLKHLTGIESMALINSKNKIVWSKPKNPTINNDNTLAVKKFNNKGFLIGRSFIDENRKTKFYISTPLRSTLGPGGQLYVIFDSAKLLRELLKTNKYSIQIREGENVLYLSSSKDKKVDISWNKNGIISWGKTTWKVDVSPTKENLIRSESIFNTIVFASCILLSISIGLLIELLMIAKEQQQILSETELRFRLMIDSVKDYGIFMLNEEGVVSTWNDGAQNITRYGPQEIIGKHFSIFYTEKDLANGMPDRELELASKFGQSEVEGWRIRKDGTQFFANVTIARILDGENKLLGFAKVTRDLSQRQLLELERKSMYKKLNMALSATGIGLWSVDLSSGKFWRSVNYDEIFGHTQHTEKWTTETFFSHVIPEDYEMVKQSFMNALKLKKSSIECRIKRIDDNSIRWLAIKYILYGNSDNSPGQVMGTIRDITTEKREALEKNMLLEWQRAIIDNASYAIISTDIDGTIISFNRAAERMLGYSADEVIHKATPQIIHDPDEVIKQAELLSATFGRKIDPGFEVFTIRASMSNYPDESEWTYIRKDGTRFPVQLAISALRESDGKINGFIGIAFDISENKIVLSKMVEEQRKALALAQEAQSLKHRLDLALQSSHTGVWEWDIKENMLIWDQRMYELYGIQKDDFPTAYDVWLNGIHPDDRLASDSAIKEALEGKSEFNTEFRVLWPDETIKYIRAFGTVQRDQSGNPLRMVGVNWDISKEKESEIELKEARESALKASQTKSEFLANMSHEIRTPINGVLGMTEILLDTKLKVKQKEYAEDIKQSATSLLLIINDILDFSKVEAGKLDLEEIEFDLKKLIKNTVKTLSFIAEAKGLRIRIKGLKRWAHYFVGDSGRITQILTNLLSNAVKFTSVGEILVRVTEIESKSSIKKYRFEVIDKGIGISNQAMSRMFKSFSQADASTTRRYGGTGLGLSICKQLVELMDGKIGVNSVEGEGSTFWFEIPLREGLNKTLPDTNKGIAEVKLKIRPTNIRVLIAEDNIINQKVTLKQLEKLGLHADAVANGLEVLSILKDKTFDLILMDCQMPEMDGYEATEIIRKNEDPWIRDMPIIALTADAISRDRQKCFDSGMSDFLSKPVTLTDLIKALDKWMDILLVRSPEGREINKKAS